MNPNETTLILTLHLKSASNLVVTDTVVTVEIDIESIPQAQHVAERSKLKLVAVKLEPEICAQACDTDR